MLVGISEPATAQVDFEIPGVINFEIPLFRSSKYGPLIWALTLFFLVLGGVEKRVWALLLYRVHRGYI